MTIQSELPGKDKAVGLILLDSKSQRRLASGAIIVRANQRLFSSP